jgi:hypothetical protein
MARFHEEFGRAVKIQSVNRMAVNPRGTRNYLQTRG